jgi:methanogenic corrinoid protein MtbC1
MLIDKGMSPGEVVSMKLTTGEEIIGKMVEENAHGIKISKPMVLSAGPQGIGMIPYMFTVSPEKDVTVNYGAIVSQSATDKQFADAYIQNTTGIKLA